MAFTVHHTGLPGVLLIAPDVYTDSRGLFLETYRQSAFDAAGISDVFVQDNHSCSVRGTLRGLHYQLPPFAQAKLVRVITGSVWDVAVDVRAGSQTRGRWVAAELSDQNHHMLFIPQGFAHGFVALEDATHLVYKCTAEYHRDSERGVRWDDPDLAISWPDRTSAGDPPRYVVSDKDEGLPLFAHAEPFL